jgi:hypothetical protein
LFRVSIVRKNHEKPLHKKIKCGKCGHLLVYIDHVSRPYYLCGNVRYTDEYDCIRGKIREKELNETVMAVFITQINLFADNLNLYRKIAHESNKPSSSMTNSILELNDEINRLQSNKRKLYEQYKNKEINQVVYLEKRETLETELTNKKTEYETLSSQKQSNENMLESAEQLSQAFAQFQSTSELTKEIADKFIEMVEVYDVDRITIKFLFQDEFENIIKMIENQ